MQQCQQCHTHYLVSAAKKVEGDQLFGHGMRTDFRHDQVTDSCIVSGCQSYTETVLVDSFRFSLKSFIRLTRKLYYFGFTSEAFIRTDFRCRSSLCKSLSHTWLKWKLPSSRFMLSVFLIHIASLISLPAFVFVLFIVMA